MVIEQHDASRISGAARGARISGRNSEPPSGGDLTAIPAFKLLTHARRYGIDRLRESCAIVTAGMSVGRLSVMPSAAFLMSTSHRVYEITPDQVRELIRAGHLNRAADGWEALNRRRYSFSTPAQLREVIDADA